jgi:hypothetical protein
MPKNTKALGPSSITGEGIDQPVGDVDLGPIASVPAERTVHRDDAERTEPHDTPEPTSPRTVDGDDEKSQETTSESPDDDTDEKSKADTDESTVTTQTTSAKAQAPGRRSTRRG